MATQVPWFVDLAAAGCSQAAVTPAGLLALLPCSSETTAEDATAHASQHKQQHAKGPAKGATTSNPREFQLSILSATTIAKLALNSENHGAATLLICHLVPQLLSCTAACEKGGLARHWASILCSAAAQLHAAGSSQAMSLGGMCLRHLQDLVGHGSGTSGRIHARSGGNLCLGDAVCFNLLSAAVGRAGGLKEAELQLLVECAIVGMSQTGRYGT